MKKTLLIGLSLGLGLSSFAQTNGQGSNLSTIKTLSSEAKVYDKKMITGYETNADGKPASERPAPIVSPMSFQRATTEILVGETTYDLQSNAACQDRIVNHGNGNISVVFTRSLTNDMGASDRGTGYTNFNITTTSPTLPVSRIENSRTGWPNIDVLGSGKEVSVAHNTDLSQLTVVKNGGPGSASWIQTDLNNGDQIWNRMGTGGYDGNSIHHISLRAPSGLGGGIFQGVDGALLYYRSLDGGLTWDIQGEFIPGLDATNYSSMSGDSYTLQVRDSVIAVAYWGDMVPAIMAKSTDNGDTWEWTKLIDHGFSYDPSSTNLDPSQGPIGISDADGDGVADTLLSTDGAGAILIDANGMVHITYGNMRYLDVTEGDDTWSYFPNTNGLMYWNESMGTNDAVLIGAALDLDGDGFFGSIGGAVASLDGGQYFVSSSGMPHMGLGDDGDVYVAFSAIMENIDNGAQAYRHIYITKSSDGGCSWSGQVDVTPLPSTNGIGECVFPSLAYDVDDNIHLVYQRDFEPGLAVRGDEDQFGDNYIEYVAIPVVDIDAEPIVNCYSFINEQEYSALCPTDSVWISTTCGLSYLWSNGETTDMVKETIGTHTVTISTSCGYDNVLTVTLADASGSGVVNFDVDATESVICDGDSTWLSSSNVSNAVYTWSDGQTGQTIGVDTSDVVFYVTVSNCAGSGIDSIAIVLPPLPVALVTGNADFCEGDSTMLTAGSEPGASYVWSNGDSTQTTYADTVSTLNVTVSNCSGSGNVNYSVIFTPAPTATFSVSSNNFCEGTSTANLVASNSDSYVWSDGSTDQSTILTSAGVTVMNVTVTNACGDSDEATAVTITINANPAVPTITLSSSSDSVVFTSDAPENNWYINGTASAIGGSTFTQQWSDIPGAEITAVATDATTGCNSSTTAGVTPVPLAIEEVAANTVKLYPNPNSGTFTIEGAENSVITIQNMLGQTVYNGKMNVSIMSFGLSNVNKGIYFVTISNDKFETTEKVIIK
ncbi:MAG: T9SS type A sorting domain-containing protein [Flavobacteriales bacterium]|nr:T9SS type A sorting domain-containing protein [Flavobacteriales bacterium]